MATDSALNPIVTESGKISVSIDGLGTIDTSGIIQVQKPSGATVRKAFLAAASTGFKNYAITNTDIQLDGVPVSFTVSMASGIESNNYFAEVTSLVKTKIDSSPTGLVDFTVTENNTELIDGEILAVIFDDPSKTADNTVVLFFGAQNTTGDSFNITLGKPVDPSDPNLLINLSLGISYGYQGTGQYSQIDVNSRRLTTSAGGQDDGGDYNGSLLTVGGIGDSNDNPTDPYALPTGPRSDDELYNLLPFVNNGDTVIRVDTLNPSMDDNIFFGVLIVQANVAIVDEGILLGPLSATNKLATEYTATSNIQDDSGNPVVGRAVNYTVISGPNAGLTGNGVTDTSGKSTFTYTSSKAGTDVLTASFVDSKGVTRVSNQVTATWETSADSPLFVDYGATYGLYKWDGAWSQLTQLNPENMVASGATLYVDYGAYYGLYKWDGAWSQIASISPESMVTSGATLYVNFGAQYGIWRWDGAWSQLTSINPEKMVASDSALYADFGASYGLYKWDGTAWSQLSSVSSVNMVTSGSTSYNMVTSGSTSRLPTTSQTPQIGARFPMVTSGSTSRLPTLK